MAIEPFPEPDPGGVSDRGSRQSRFVMLWREIPRLATLAFPLIAGLTASTLNAIIDTVMLGPLGEVPLAVVSLTTSGLSILYAGLYGFMGPVAIFAGHAHGAADDPRVGAALHHGRALGALGGAIASALMIAALPLLWWMGQPEAVLEAMPAYWLCIAGSMAPFTVMLAYKQVYDSVDRAWLAMVLMLGGEALNVPLNWLLIYGHWGFPALGVTGAGIASLVSTLVALAVLAGHWRWSHAMAPYRGPMRLSRAGTLDQLREGTPMAAQYLLEGSAFAIAGLMVGWFGATALAANQIVTAVTFVIYMAPLGMSAAVSIRVAQALGKGGRERAGAIGWAAIALVTAWMLSFTVFLTLFGQTIAGLFVDTPDVIAAAASLFTVVAIMQIFDGIQSTSLGALRGLMDNRWPTVITLIAYWGAALPSSYLLGVGLDWGINGVWAGFGVGLALAAFALAWRFHILTTR